MDRKLLATLVVVLGIAIVLVSALADPLGLGSEGGKFGWKQILGIVVGATVVVGGLLLRRVGPPTASGAAAADGARRGGEGDSFDRPSDGPHS